MVSTNPVKNITGNRIMSMLKVPISIGITVYLDYMALEYLYAIGRGIAPGMKEQCSGLRTLVDSHIYMHETPF